MKATNAAVLFAAVAAAIFSLSVRTAFAASRIFSPPAQISAKSVNLGVWAASGGDELSLTATRANRIDVGGIKYESLSETIFEVTRRTAGVGAQAVYNPSDAMDFVFSGFTGTQELGVATVSGENVLSGDSSAVGFGLRKVVQPGTLVTPAVTIAYSADFSRARLESMKADGVVSSVNAVFTTAEYSVAATFSKKSDIYETWTSVKVARIYSELADRAVFEKISGMRDRASLSAGLKINFRPEESLFVEAGLAPVRYAAIGISVGF
jgi:hypothetical protein